MGISFNIIAFMLPLISAAELEVAGRVMGRVVRDAIACPACGVRYSLIVPACSSGAQIDRAKRELRDQVSSTCGQHPPVVQKQ
jgi:hypothetical protein